jgi:probable phosphoglycerate mutase
MYLFRHGAVDYVDASGKVVADTGAVVLNDKGRAEADAMGRLFADVAVDRAVCSGLERTRETATRVLYGRNMEVEINAALNEIHSATDQQADFDLFRDVAYCHWQAGEHGSRFLGGELYAEFYGRVSAAMEAILADPDWHNIALFAHGGTNAAILGWVTGLGLNAFGLIDQATGCLNVIDFDVDSNDRSLRRKVIRGMNITAGDPAKGGRHSGDLEALARQLLRFAG